MVDVVRGTKHQWHCCGQLTTSPASFCLKSSLAFVFCFLCQLHFTVQGSLFAFASAYSASGIESPLDHNTLLTNSTDVPPFCPHFVCKLILLMQAHSLCPRVLFFPTLFRLFQSTKRIHTYSYMAEEFVSHLRRLTIGSLIPFSTSLVA